MGVTFGSAPTVQRAASDCPPASNSSTAATGACDTRTARSAKLCNDVASSGARERLVTDCTVDMISCMVL
jgi:hypothetical protein